ncbi:MAG: hypothetical protein F6K00_08710 [Leptolyngbya sp. SIOISBB]|nr:hypothetical protein [Leptolyngbya sp. SIOISBB]
MRIRLRFWLSSTGRFFGIALASFVMTACWPSEYPPRLVSQVEYETSEHIVKETIYEQAGWSDPIYKRIYEIDGEVIAQFEDESDVGIAAQNPPRIVAEWLVITSASRVFFWQPDSELVEFYPWLAEEWENFSNQEQWGFQLNGFYDYAAEDVQILSASASQPQRWLVTYRCVGLICPETDSPFNAPESIQFYSDDQGQTFHLLRPEAS